MPKIKYVNKRFHRLTESIIVNANAIIEEYMGQGFVLTVRQLYYKFIARDLFPEPWYNAKERTYNTLQNYKKFVKVMSDARMSGLTDWYAIEDRTRNLQSLSHWGSPSELLDSAVMQYLRDRWELQSQHVEVWIEKDALTGVIDGVCRMHDIAYFSCRGYNSLSEMWRTAQRLKRIGSINGQDPIILHLGDHDPSGLDMTRDIQKRFSIFECPVVVKRIALNFEQIKKYKPPPNYAKVTDSRYRKYVEEYGEECWELDALEPAIITDLIDKEVSNYIDKGLLEVVRVKEESERRQLWNAKEDLTNG